MKYLSKTLVAGCILSALAGCNTRTVEVGGDNGGGNNCSLESPSEHIDSLQLEANGLEIGVALPAGEGSKSVFNRPDLQALTTTHFSQITAENIMKPVYLQPTQGNFEFDDSDQFVDFALQNGMSVHGHMLVWHKRLADFQQNCQGAAQCTQYMTDHIQAVMAHYQGKMVSWDVVNEAFTDDHGWGSTYRNQDDLDNGVEGSVWYREIGKEYIPLAFTAAHQADPSTELYYNDYQLERDNDKLAQTLKMVNELQAADVPIHGIGFQMHITYQVPTLSQLRSALQKVVATGLKVKITEMDVRMNEDGSETCYSTEVAKKQQQRYQDVIDAYLEIVPKNQQGGISFWGASDADSWIPDFYDVQDWPLLFDGNLKQKHAIVGVAKALRAAQ